MLAMKVWVEYVHFVCIQSIPQSTINYNTIIEIIECVQYKIRALYNYNTVIVYRFVSRGFCFAAAFGSLADEVEVLCMRHFVGYLESGRIFICWGVYCNVCSLCVSGISYRYVRNRRESMCRVGWMGSVSQPTIRRAGGHVYLGITTNGSFF